MPHRPWRSPRKARRRPAFRALSPGLPSTRLQDVIIKLASGHYPISEVLFFRAATALPLLLVIVHFDGGLRQLVGAGLLRMLARGGLMITGFTCYYLGLAVLPLASATAMFFTAPLFITILSALLLGEAVAPRRWLAVIAGFIGVALMVRPGSGLFTIASLLPLVAASTYALSQMLSRTMPQDVRATAMSFHGNLAFLVASSLAALAFGDGRYAGEGHASFAFLFRGWVMPDARDAALLMALGPIGAAGLILVAGAYRRTSASIVAPFEYSAILWGILWGIVVFGQMPGASGFAGMALIAAGGLSIIYFEWRAKEPIAWRRAGFRRYRRQVARLEEAAPRPCPRRACPRCAQAHQQAAPRPRPVRCPARFGAGQGYRLHPRRHRGVFAAGRGDQVGGGRLSGGRGDDHPLAGGAAACCSPWCISMSASAPSSAATGTG